MENNMAKEFIQVHQKLKKKENGKTVKELDGLEEEVNQLMREIEIHFYNSFFTKIFLFLIFLIFFYLLFIQYIFELFLTSDLVSIFFYSYIALSAASTCASYLLRSDIFY